MENHKASVSVTKEKMGCEFVLRALAFLLTLTAAIVLGVNKQTKVVPLRIVPTLPPVDLPVTAKSHYLSAFVYEVVVNAIACAYSCASLLLMLAKKGKSMGMLAPAVVVADTVMVALLFSGTGAAGAIALLGLKGNSHVMWKKVCNVFGRFCGQAAAALALSQFAATAYLLLVVLAALRLHKASQ